MLRNIHFYRADCGTDGAGAPVAFSPTAMLAHIDKLKFDATGRYCEVLDNTYCAWVDRSRDNCRLRFAVIRREGLPFVEQAGVVSALNIPAAAGLVEQIHVRVFNDNIVGCDFNFYGPRLPRLSTYLDARGGPQKTDVVFEPLAQRDILSVLDGYDGVRMFQFRIRDADIALLAKADKNLAKAFEAQRSLSQADEYEIILRPKAYSRDTSLGSRAQRMARKLATREDILDAAKAFKVRGIVDGEPTEVLNILDERLVSEQAIKKEATRGRALDSTSAYAAIEAAEKELRDEIAAAASLAGPSATP